MRGFPAAPPGAGADRRHVRLDPIEPHQLPALPLDIRHPSAGQGLQTRAKPAARGRRVLGDAPPLAAILREENDDAVSLAVPVGPKNQRFGGMGPHSIRASAWVSAPMR